MRTAIRIALLSVALVSVAVAAAVSWLAFSTDAARLLVRWIERSEQRLTVAEVEGSLARGVSIRGLVYRQDGLRVEIDRAHVAWSWSALGKSHARFRRLALGRVSVSIVADTERAQLPASLAIPLSVSVEEGRIDQLLISTASHRLMVEEIKFRASADQSKHVLDLIAARLPQGTLSGTAQIETNAPFVLQGAIDFSPRTDEHFPGARLGLTGDLRELHANFSAQANWLQASGSAILSPFEPVVWKRVLASADRILLHQLLPDAPQAELRGTLDVRQIEQDRFEGELVLENTDPGELGQGKLPITALTSRFGGAFDRVDIALLELRTAQGPPLTGEGGFDSGALNLRLNARGLDLKAWDKRLVSTKLSGSLRVDANARTQSLAALLTEGEYRIEIDASRSGDTLTVKRARAAARGGILTLSGEVALDPVHEFRAQGRLHRFDPSAFLEVPPARINADITAQGKLAPELNAQLQVRADGQGPRGAALYADARASIRHRRISELRGKLSLGRNEVSVAGAYGAASDQLTFDAKLRALQELDPGISGALEAQGHVAGDFARPEIHIGASATQVTVTEKKLRMGSVRLRAVLPNDWDKTVDFEASAADVQFDTLKVDKVTAVVRGSPRAHTVDATAQGKDIDVRLQFSGALSSLRAWSGALTRLDATHPVKVSMLAPAPLSLTPEKVEVGPFALSAMEARVAFGALSWAPGLFRSSGEFSRLPVERFLRATGRTMRSTLTLNGEWTIEQQAGVVRGALNVTRDAGDIVMTGDGELPLALTMLHAQANIADKHIRATVHATSASLGEFRAAVTTEAVRNGNLWAIPSSAPLTLEAKGHFPSIVWMGPLIEPGVAVAGTLTLDVTGQGTLGAPRLEGAIQGKGLSIRLPASGIALVEGELDAALANDRILIRALRFKGGDGFVTAQGEAGIRKGTNAQLRVSANKLTLLSRRNALVELDATGDIVSDAGMVRIKADARITRGHLDLQRTVGKPVLAADIRVKDDKPAQAAQQPLRLTVDLNVDFGDRFSVTANKVGIAADSALKQLSGDFKARIEGRVHTSLDANHVLQTRGRLNVVDGTYTTFGRQFRVERGNLNFSGPLGNPALDILVAAAKSSLRMTPEVGISITGTALVPRVRLVSQPEMPETEKLSWLLFGRGGQAYDYSVGSTTGQVAAPATEFGWQLSQNLYLAYEQGTTGTSNVMRIFSQLSERIAIQAGAGDVSSLFLLYTFTFR